MKLTFIVNGTETTVKGKPSSKLKTLIKKALEQTGNLGRPATDFQPWCNDYPLRPEHSILEQVEMNTTKKPAPQIVINEESIIFLSLKSGVGALHRTIGLQDALKAVDGWLNSDDTWVTDKNGNRIKNGLIATKSGSMTNRFLAKMKKK